MAYVFAGYAPLSVRVLHWMAQPQWAAPIASIFVGLLTNSSKLQSRKGVDRKERTENLSYFAWHELLAQRLAGW